MHRSYTEIHLISTHSVPQHTLKSPPVTSYNCATVSPQYLFAHHVILKQLFPLIPGQTLSIL